MKEKAIKTTEFHGLSLDEYQKRAIFYIEDEQSVIVSAPTGKGKTLIADYCIELYISKNFSVVYTAPTKALSNQKYQDFCELFGEDKVGILTGDVVINRNAPLLIMTTEIYRNMLQSEPDEIANIKYVIFDEIHYIDDDERGTVWEECFLLKPKHIHFLGLSGTISNVEVLAKWIQSINNEKVYVVKESKRAVPLTYKYFISKGRIVDYEEACLWADYKLCDSSTDFSFRASDNSFHLDLVKALKPTDFPCLYFSFSRSKCFNKACELANLWGSVDENTIAKIDNIVNSTFNEFSLKKESINNFYKYRELFYKGIGVHHAGLPSILKHITEKLFKNRLIKIIYCTETFAVGVNFPVKTVCLDTFIKFDGKGYRKLKYIEFFQMAGRAGRRGIDTEGQVITVLNCYDISREGVPYWDESKVEKIGSSFNLSYNTVIHMFKDMIAEKHPQILTKNFAVFLALQKANDIKEAREEDKKKISKLTGQACINICKDICPIELKRLKKQLNKKATKLKRKGIDTIPKKLRREKERLDRLSVYGCSKEKQEKCKYIIPEYNSALSSLSQHAKLYNEMCGYSPSRDLEAEYSNKLKVLDELGYINISKNCMLPRGETLKNIYFQELLKSELLFSDFLYKYDIPVICGALAGIDFIPRKNDTCHIPYKDMQTKYAAKDIKNLMTYVEEIEYNISNKVSSIFSDIPCEIIYYFSKGKEIKDILSLTTMSDGDIAGVARRTIALLRQIKSASIDNKAICDKIDKCILCLDRSIVKTVL